MDETFNEPLAVSLFVGTVVLGIVTVWITKRLLRRASAPNDRAKKPRFRWALHILAFLFLFVPVVVWSLVEVPSVFWIPAVLAAGMALYGYANTPAKDKLGAIVVVVAAPVMWVCYGLYEHQMQFWGRTVDTPIRIDLELIAPLLYYSSLMLFRFGRDTTREPAASQ